MCVFFVCFLSIGPFKFSLSIGEHFSALVFINLKKQKLQNSSCVVQNIEYILQYFAGIDKVKSKSQCVISGYKTFTRGECKGKKKVRTPLYFLELSDRACVCYYTQPPKSFLPVENLSIWLFSCTVG